MAPKETIVDRIRTLANAHGYSLTTLETKLGMGNGTISRWNQSSPGSDKLAKIADLFNVSTDYLLGREQKEKPTETGERTVSDNELKFALFRGREGITDAMYEEVLNFAEYVARREEEKKKE